MDLFALHKKIAKKMEWYDMAFLKMSVFFFTLFVITAWAGFRNFVLGIEWHWYFILFIVFSIPLFKKLFAK